MKMLLLAFCFAGCARLSAADNLDTLFLKQAAAKALIEEGNKDIAYGGELAKEQDIHLAGVVAVDNSGMRESGQQHIENGSAKVEEGTRELADINAEIVAAKEHLRARLANANFRLWHDKTGRTINAELEEILGDKVHILRDDGVEFFLSRDLLSTEDNDWLKRCERTAQLTAEVAAGKSTILDAISPDELDFHWRDKQGYNALMYAVVKGNLDSVKKLVALGYPINDRQDLLDQTTGVVYRGAGLTAGEMVGLNPHPDVNGDLAILGPAPSPGISVESLLKDYAVLEADPAIIAKYGQTTSAGSSKEVISDLSACLPSLLDEVDLYQSCVVPCSFTVINALSEPGDYEIRLDGYVDVCVLHTATVAFSTTGYARLPLEFMLRVPAGDALPDGTILNQPVLLFREQVVQDSNGTLVSSPTLAASINSQCADLINSLKTNAFPLTDLVDFYDGFMFECKNLRRAGPSILVGNAGALTTGPDADFYNTYYGVRDLPEFNLLRYALLKNIFDHWKPQS